MAKLHSDRYQAISINGAEYRAQKQGVFDVPDEIAGRLMADFGLSIELKGDDDEVNYLLWTTPELLAEAKQLGVDTAWDMPRKSLIAEIKAAKAAMTAGATR